MQNPFHKWLLKLVEKEVNIHCTDVHGRTNQYDGRLVYVDKDVFIVVNRRSKASICNVKEVDEIEIDEKDLRIRNKVKVQELK